MNRREAIAALVALPSVKSIATVPAASNEVIVVECDEYLEAETEEHLRRRLAEIWPERKILVLDKTLRIKLAPR